MSISKSRQVYIVTSLNDNTQEDVQHANAHVLTSIHFKRQRRFSHQVHSLTAIHDNTPTMCTQ